LGKSLKHDRWFDEFDFEPHEDNIEQRRKEEKERRRVRHKKELDLEEVTEPFHEPVNRNRKY
jgi:hypothetical protein